MGRNTWRRLGEEDLWSHRGWEKREEVGMRMGRGMQRVLKWDLDFLERQEGTQSVHGARQEQNSSSWGEPWEQQVGTWDKSSSFGVSRKAQGGFETH